MKAALYFTLLCAIGANAGGQFTIVQPFYSTPQNYSPEMGLYIREPIVGPWFYESWSGFRQGLGSWRRTDHSLFHSFGSSLDLGIGVGAGTLTREENEIRAQVSAKVKLW